MSTALQIRPKEPMPAFLSARPKEDVLASVPLKPAEKVAQVDHTQWITKGCAFARQQKNLTLEAHNAIKTVFGFDPSVATINIMGQPIRWWKGIYTYDTIDPTATLNIGGTDGHVLFPPESFKEDRYLGLATLNPNIQLDFVTNPNTPFGFVDPQQSTVYAAFVKPSSFIQKRYSGNPETVAVQEVTHKVFMGLTKFCSAPTQNQIAQEAFLAGKPDMRKENEVIGDATSLIFDRKHYTYRVMDVHVNFLLKKLNNQPTNVESYEYIFQNSQTALNSALRKMKSKYQDKLTATGSGYTGIRFLAAYANWYTKRYETSEINVTRADMEKFLRSEGYDEKTALQFMSILEQEYVNNFTISARNYIKARRKLFPTY
jgi:hypothetical protein